MTNQTSDKPPVYKCGHCGHVGRRTTNGFGAHWCSKCEMNNKLEEVKSDGK